MRAKHRAPKTRTTNTESNTAAIFVALDILPADLRYEAISLIRYHVGDQEGVDERGAVSTTSRGVFSPATAHRLSSACDIILRDMLLEELDLVGRSEDLIVDKADTPIQAELQRIREEALRRLHLVRMAYNTWAKRR